MVRSLPQLELQEKTICPGCTIYKWRPQIHIHIQQSTSSTISADSRLMESISSTLLTQPLMSAQWKGVRPSWSCKEERSEEFSGCLKGKHSYLKTCATVGAFGSPESSGSGDGNNSSNNGGGSNPDFSRISFVL
ncbi:unnamed protein product [Camellia sinensis]